MAGRGQASVFVSITTLDDGLQRRMEPRASSIDKRLEIFRRLSEAGVPTGVLASPMIPALNDAELEKILETARDAGARSASYLLIRLPLELKGLFEEWLRLHYPQRADHVLSLVRSAHEGGLYRSEFGTRMRGSGAYADILARRFETAIKRLGLAARNVELETAPFRRPSKDGDGRQLALF
jgi:DNA repair photolyase